MFVEKFQLIVCASSGMIIDSLSAGTRELINPSVIRTLANTPTAPEIHFLSTPRALECFSRFHHRGRALIRAYHSTTCIFRIIISTLM